MYWRHMTMAGALVSALFCGCEGGGDKLGSAMPPAVVTTTTVKKQTIPYIKEFIGVGESSHQVEIRGRVEGYLESIDYVEGTLVNQNDLLFTIDQRPFIAALDQAKATLARAQAELWDAQKSQDRMTKLYDKKAVSQRDFENSTARLLSAQASVDGAAANVEQAKLNLSYTVIISPVKGLTNYANLREGALVIPGSSNNSLLTTVSVIDPIWVNFNISERGILKFREQVFGGSLVPPKEDNYDIEVIFADGTTYSNIGKIDFASPTINQQTGTMMVRAIFSNPDRLVLPGQFVNVRVSGANLVDAIALPKEAIMQGSKGNYVYVLNDQDIAEMRLVLMGDWYGDLWQVKDGLRAGERVVVKGTNKVLPGAKVIVNDDGDSKVEEQKVQKQVKEQVLQQKLQQVQQMKQKVDASGGPIRRDIKRFEIDRAEKKIEQDLQELQKEDAKKPAQTSFKQDKKIPAKGQTKDNKGSSEG